MRIGAKHRKVPVPSATLDHRKLPVPKLLKILLASLLFGLIAGLIVALGTEVLALRSSDQTDPLPPATLVVVRKSTRLTWPPKRVTPISTNLTVYRTSDSAQQKSPMQ